MIDIDVLVRKNIRDLKPYSSARDDFDGDAMIFLDANENPYGNIYNRYPDPHQRKLKEQISAIKNVDSQQILLGNGSDEVIDLMIRVFCEPGVDNVLIPQPTYGIYSVSANISGVNIISIPLTQAFDIDIESSLRAITPTTKVIFLCSPNNPSGNLLSESAILKLLTEFKGIVVIDEAYIDFSGSESFISRLSDFKNLVVIQTLSKAWGLAGIRLGMCFASSQIIEVLNKIKPPYNVSECTQLLALEGLGKVDTKNEQAKEILEQRSIVAEEISLFPCVEQVYPSDANFILVRLKDAKSTYRKLLEKGIVVRNRSNLLLCNDCLRITIGTPIENQLLLEALKVV